MILYFFIIFATPAYADSLDVSKDASTNLYYHTVALGSESYPEIDDIQYIRSEFMAENTSGILSTGISGYTDFDFTRRIPMVADRIYGPPGTLVDIIYLFKNGTGHSVNISKVDLILSRNNKESGNITEVLNISDFTEGNLLYKYSHQNLMKSGIYKEYAGLKNIPTDTENGYVLETVSINNPLEVEQAKFLRNSDKGIDITIYIRNTSNEYLNNLVFKYLSHEEKFDLGVGEEHIVKFSLLNPKDELGNFSIYNPNIKEVCAVYGSPFYTYTDTNAVGILAVREDAIVPGAVVQPARESICIKRIAYTMLYDNWIEDSSAEDTEAVLGIEADTITEEKQSMVLPKTGKQNLVVYILLVVDVVLWYSLNILRRKYESKNVDSRLRTKSGKNAG